MEHRPRFLEHGLPANGVLTVDDLHALPEDPWWKYELIEGTLFISSDARLITWDDLQTFPDDPHWKYELIEGMLIVSPNAPDLPHQSCVLSLALLLRSACPPELQAVIAPFEYKPVGESSLQPDLLIARRPIEPKRLTRTPLLVVKVLSPGTRMYDVNLKRAMYAERGVEHFWLVDPHRPSIEAQRLVDGVYETVVKAEAGETFEVSEPVALSFDPQVLLDE